MSPLDFAILGTGASFGAFTRHIVTQRAQSSTNFLPPPPFHIALVNVVGSFILGSLYGYREGYTALPKPVKLKSSKLLPLPPRTLLFLGVGYCGALTTFSTFSTDTLALLQASRFATAASYIALNNIGGIGAAGVGFYCLKRAVPVMAKIGPR